MNLPPDKGVCVFYSVPPFATWWVQTYTLALFPLFRPVYQGRSWCPSSLEALGHTAHGVAHKSRHRWGAACTGRCVRWRALPAHLHPNIFADWLVAGGCGRRHAAGDVSGSGATAVPHVCLCISGFKQSTLFQASAVKLSIAQLVARDLLNFMQSFDVQPTRE
jgi:hypothetical protein